MYHTPIERELERRKAICALVDAMPSLRAGVASQLLGDLLEDPQMSSDRARDAIQQTISEEEEKMKTELNYAMGDVKSLKLQQDLVPVICARAGIGGQAMKDAARASRLNNVIDLAEAAKLCLDREGIAYADLSRDRCIIKAMQTTSDFPILFENVLNKTLLEGYRAAPATWRMFCREGTVSDFRAHGRYRTGSLADLAVTNEAGEYQSMNIPDGEKSAITAESRGGIVRITFQSLVNDDLAAIRDPARDLGISAARTVENAVYSLLKENSGLGPTLADGNPFFHSSRSNVGTGAALSSAAIEADRVLMAGQSDISGNQFLDLRPSAWVGPLALGGTARVINDAQYDPDKPNKLQRPNVVRGLFRDIVDSPRLSGTRWYLFSDPDIAPALEVAFLNGASEPSIVQEEQFSSRGMAFRASLDFGVATIDHRGAVTNAGA